MSFDALIGLIDLHCRSFCGSVAYLAPEILTRQGHGRTVDLYGLGVSPGDVFFSLRGHDTS